MRNLILEEENLKIINEVSKVIQSKLKEKNISINKISEDIGVHPNSIRNIINCKNNPTIVIIVKICDYLDIDMGELHNKDYQIEEEDEEKSKVVLIKKNKPAMQELEEFFKNA